MGKNKTTSDLYNDYKRSKRKTDYLYEIFLNSQRADIKNDLIGKYYEIRCGIIKISEVEYLRESRYRISSTFVRTLTSTWGDGGMESLFESNASFEVDLERDMHSFKLSSPEKFVETLEGCIGMLTEKAPELIEQALYGRELS